jgi:NADH:ubiquinone oxidoreductase subunit K
MRDVLIKVGMTAAAIAVFSLLVFSKDAAVQLGVLVVFRRRLHQLTGRNVRSAVSS